MFRVQFLGFLIGVGVSAASFGACPEVVDYTSFKTLHQVETLVTDCRMTSIDEFFAKLPLRLRKRYNMIYKTRGAAAHLNLHGKGLGIGPDGHPYISAKYPRFMVSGVGNFLTFTTDSNPHSPFFGVLELMEYNPALKDLVFKTIHFHESRLHAVKISERNPSECLTCHRHPNSAIAKNRVIIADFPGPWLGFYGSLLDRYHYLERVNDTQNWPLRYPHSEQLAYNRYIKPKLGNARYPIFKHFPADIYLDEYKDYSNDFTDDYATATPEREVGVDRHKNFIRTGYNFRTAIRPMWNLKDINNAVNMDALVKHVRNLEAKKTEFSIDNIKYYLTYANTCVDEKDSFTPGILAEEFTPQEMLDTLKKFVSDEMLDRMLAKAQVTQKLSGGNRLEILENLYLNLKEKIAQNDRAAMDANCKNLNDLYSVLGRKQSVSCDNLMQSTFTEGLSLYHKLYPTAFSEGSLYDNYPIIHARNTAAVYTMIYLMMNYIDFPFEWWSPDAVSYSAYGTNRNINMDLQGLLITRMDFDKTDPDLYAYISKEYRIHDRYRPHSEQPSYPEKWEHFDAFFIKPDKNYDGKIDVTYKPEDAEKGFCPTILAPKSLNYTNFTF